MSAGFISLSTGVLIGLIYALLKVRSPAPPALALVGLLGMLAGERLTVQMLQPEQTCQAQLGAMAAANTPCPVKGE